VLQEIELAPVAGRRAHPPRTVVRCTDGDGMRILKDYEGWSIRLTDERLAHILEHPEMQAMEQPIEETLLHPERVLQSLSDPQARLYYRMYLATLGGTSIYASWSSWRTMTHSS
jgi:hypothetical protein